MDLEPDAIDSRLETWISTSPRVRRREVGGRRVWPALTHPVDLALSALSALSNSLNSRGVKPHNPFWGWRLRNLSWCTSLGWERKRPTCLVDGTYEKICERITWSLLVCLCYDATPIFYSHALLPTIWDLNLTARGPKTNAEPRIYASQLSPPCSG